MLVLILSILFPLAGGALLLSRRDGKRVDALACAFGVSALLLNVCALVGDGALAWRMSGAFVFALGLDSFGRLLYALVPVLFALAALYTASYAANDRRRARLYGFFLLTLGALNGLCAARNLFTFYLFFEFVSLLSYPLVLHEGTDKARRAALTYLGFSVAGAALALGGVLLAGTDALSAFTAGGAGLDGKRDALAFLLIAVGFGAKAGLYPLSMWLPTAHPEAPAPASALLSGVITKAGVLGAVRAAYYVFDPAKLRGTAAQSVLLGLAAASVFIGSMLAYREPILKKRLAYSSVSQLSYALLGFLLLTRAGFVGGVLQVLFHALTKTGLFFCAGSFIHATGKTRVDELAGVGRDMPVTTSCFALLSLSLIGIPPLGGFIAKWRLCEGALAFGGWFGTACVVLLLVSALLTAGYLLPIVARGFFPGQAYAGVEREDDWRMLTPVVLLAAGVLVLGAFPAAFDRLGGALFDLAAKGAGL